MLGYGRIKSLQYKENVNWFQKYDLVWLIVGEIKGYF